MGAGGCAAAFSCDGYLLIKLLWGVPAFLVAPILACSGDDCGSFIGGTTFYLAGKGALEPPDLRQWRGEDEPAWKSPSILSRLQRSRPSRSQFPMSGHGERAA